MASPTITILAAGAFPRRKKVRRLLSEADLVICCDGAAASLLAFGREPDLIVGDLDSLPNELKQRFAGRLRHFAGQDDNDLSKAFHVALEFNPAVIHILGATGRREDHTLGNISLLAEYQREVPLCKIDMVSDRGRFVSASGQCTFQCVAGQQISIFAFDSALRMTSAGLQYPLSGVVFDTLWKATLNRACGSEFTLTPSNGSYYLVYFCD